MTLTELIARTKGDLNKRIIRHNELAEQVNGLRAGEAADAAREDDLRAQRAAVKAEIDDLTARLDMYEAELRDEQRLEALDKRVTPTGAPEMREERSGVRVTEQRTYSKDNDTRGERFLSDVTSAFLGDFTAAQRLQRHTQEEVVERGGDGFLKRAAGTGAFAGYVIPQYLVDMNVGAITPKRPFADVCRKHVLPETGMTVYLSRVTTGTSVDNQSSENSALSETDIDDTLIPVSVQTAGGSQTLSRQAIERGVLTEDVTIADLLKRHATNLDAKLLTQATNGLTNVAGTVAYTDASPTGAELYPKILGALSAAENVFLNEAEVNLVVMHNRRWRWLSSQMTSTWPLVAGQRVPAQAGAIAEAMGYDKGIKGFLPDGTAVIVDNNIPTNLGAGTNEDEIYAVAPEELHLWEDPAGVRFIRAEQTQSKKLSVDLVIYSYYAYLFNRFGTSHQKVAGTGLITPVF